MISFDLKCDKGHVFEAWFRSSSAYQDQKTAGFISCPECGSIHISKAIMAPNVAAKSNQRAGRAQPENTADLSPPSAPAVAKPVEKPASMAAGGPKIPDAMRAEVVQYVKALKAEVEKTCDNVGKDFPEEARKIHYGEAEERGIYGEATSQDVQDLLDEGIDLLPLPDMGKNIQ